MTREQWKLRKQKQPSTKEMSLTIKEAKPVRTPDGEIECFTIKIKGKFFYCVCGCNCFHKPDDTRLDYYACNSCKTTYEAT